MKCLVRLFVSFFFHSYFLENNFKKKESEFHDYGIKRFTIFIAIIFMLRDHLFNFKMLT